MEESVLVELGGGLNPHPRADYIIDLHHPKGARPQDAMVTPWSHGERLWFKSDCADEIYASHFMEHIPAGQPRIDVMNEAWRVLRPGGTFMIVGPLVGYSDPVSGEPHSKQIGWQPWADPTHVSHWWFPESLLYFCEGPFKPHANYGISIWAPLGTWVPESDADDVLMLNRHQAPVEGVSFWSVRGGWEGVSVLVKP